MTTRTHQHPLSCTSGFDGLPAFDERNAEV